MYLSQYWRFFIVFCLGVVTAAQPALADALSLQLNTALSCTGGSAGGTGASIFGGAPSGTQPTGTQQMATCGAGGFFSRFVCLFETTLGMVIATFFCKLAEAFGRPVPSGEFGSDMQVRLTNDGPVTILMDSKNRE